MRSKRTSARSGRSRAEQVSARGVLGAHECALEASKCALGAFSGRTSARSGCARHCVGGVMPRDHPPKIKNQVWQWKDLIVTPTGSCLRPTPGVDTKVREKVALSKTRHMTFHIAVSRKCSTIRRASVRVSAHWHHQSRSSTPLCFVLFGSIGAHHCVLCGQFKCTLHASCCLLGFLIVCVSVCWGFCVPPVCLCMLGVR